jgi:hypothetical protein
VRNPLFTFYFLKKNAQPNVDIGGIVDHHCLSFLFTIHKYDT